MSPETREALLETLAQARLENRRLRISQLRRMIHVANDGGRDGFFERCLRFACNVRREDAGRDQSIVPRIVRLYAVRRKFVAACLAEIERLRALS